MKLFTQIPLSTAQSQIDYSSRLLLLGSCFSENIGAKFSHFKFLNEHNPLGILFHPLAIEKLIDKAIHEQLFTENDIFNDNERWHCFDAHSKLSNSSKEKIITDLNSAIGLTQVQLTKASHVIITLGTAWVYRKTSNQQIVANCHKVPQTNFTKELLDCKTIEQSLARMMSLVQSVNPTVEFIFTVSPVRHLKDGFVENQLSKSHLISAIHEVVKLDGASYFPSYEIMMDELRDYRFYAKDMVHPNEIAIDYVWGKFCEVWIDGSVSDTMTKVDEIQRGLKHRAFNPEGIAHQKFITSLKCKIAYIKLTYPFMDFKLPEV
ncbi:GSCFA domain-containing protein [uncultured Maribacter sp.]|uniref:GSCFA domain-containing protein n=1 Tax=uncultured Maribacter sp. TaxID=431308 RepID=UPI0030EB658D|tara:strand:- start:42161 stop:43120 length:960 start_codon:yes stop_codon:yes gene_type:complete